MSGGIARERAVRTGNSTCLACLDEFYRFFFSFLSIQDNRARLNGRSGGGVSPLGLHRQSCAHRRYQFER